MIHFLQKENNRTWLKIGLVLLIVGCFVLPAYSYAAEATPGNVIKTPLYELLRDDKALHKFWNEMMTLVNSFVVLLLIFVAFCEILNINISTYGVKKILPSLVFAVLAANFSWIMCRLFIDWANIAMSRFGGDTSIIDPLIGSREAFTININARIDTANTTGSLLTGGGQISFFQAGMKTLFVWAGAIALYILTFLLLLRNVIIIALAVFSPVAFMAMVLPQTKSAFNKWWTTFMQWTFMPTVSVFMLWIGSKVQDSISGADPLIGFLIAIGFIYGAIKVPFSMSGAASGIMNKFADMGKKSAKFVGNAAYTASGAKGGVELMKLKGEVIKTKVGNKIKDVTGMGSALDIQKDKLARAQKRSKSISDKKVGEYIGKRGKNDKEGEMTSREKRYAMEEAETANNEGTTDYANKKLMAGLAGEAEKGTELGEKVQKMRMSSQKAGYEMAAFDKDWAKLNDEMKIALMKGTTHEGENIEDAIKSGKWKNGNAITEDEKKKGQAQLDFLKQYGKSMLDGEIAAGTAKSSEGKIVTKIALERQAIDNVIDEKKQSKELVETLDKLEALESIMGPLSVDETNALEANTKALEAAGYKRDEFTNEFTQGTRDIIRDRKTLGEDSYRDKIADISTRYGTTREDIPAYLQNSLKFDATTGALIDLQGMETDERKVVNRLVQAKIKDDAAEEVEKHGTTQIVSSVLNGRDGDWKREDFLNWAAGQGSKNDPKANAKLVAAIEAMGANIQQGIRVSIGNSGEAVRGKIDAYYGDGRNAARLRATAAQINKSFGGRQVVKENGTADQLRDQIKDLFEGGARAASMLLAEGYDTSKDKKYINQAQNAVAGTLQKPDRTSGGNSSRIPSEV